MNAYLSTAKEYRNLERQIALGSKPSAFRRLFGGAKAKVQNLANKMYARKKLAPINYKLSIGWKQHLMDLLRKQQAAQQKVENLKRSWMSVRIRTRTTNNISNFKSKLNDAQRNLEEAKRKVKNARKQKVLTIGSTEYTKKGMTPTVSAVKRVNAVLARAAPVVKRVNAVLARNNNNEFHNALESHPLVNNPLFNNSNSNNNFHNASQNFNNNKLAVKVANNAAASAAAVTRANLLAAPQPKRINLLAAPQPKRINLLRALAAPQLRSSGLLQVAGEPEAKTWSERFFSSKLAANAKRNAERREAALGALPIFPRYNLGGRAIV